MHTVRCRREVWFISLNNQGAAHTTLRSIKRTLVMYVLVYIQVYHIVRLNTDRLRQSEGSSFELDFEALKQILRQEKKSNSN